MNTPQLAASLGGSSKNVTSLSADRSDGGARGSAAASSPAVTVQTNYVDDATAWSDALASWLPTNQAAQQVQ
ncbi:MAG: hypothetical protein ACOYN0_18505 [Phycisphaerales bacterium]